MLAVRVDFRRKDTLAAGNKLTAGLLLSRLCESSNPLKGPLALGVRVQDSWRVSDAAEFDLAAARVLGKAVGSSGALLDSDDAANALNFELRSNVQVGEDATLAL